MSEYAENAKNFEGDKPTKRSIEELLPRYYEAHGDKTKYEVIRSIPIDGHEVAWMNFTGTVEFDTIEGKPEVREYSGNTLKCACSFEEGVGWRTDEQYGVMSIGGADKCLQKEIAIHLRQQELRREYIEIYKEDAKWGEEYALLDHVPEVVMDLIERGKNGEFIGESTSGAHFWGGHMYMQTVAAITGKSMGDLWKDMDSMRAAKQINLEGCVIQEYREPPKPSWSEYGRFEYEGYTGIAYLPNSRQMPQHWQITILGPDKSVIAESIKGPEFTHETLFGMDVEDVAAVEESIQQAIEQYLWDPMSQA